MSERIDERISARYDDLSPQERRAAETLMENLDDLATYRSAELAELAGVSKATMSRLFRSLGYADFDEVRDHLRGLRTAGAPGAYLAHEQDSLRRALENPALPDVVAAVAAARRVLVVGWRNSRPVALHLRQQLAHARPGVRPGEEITDLEADDVLLLVGFRPAAFAATLASAAATGATVVLLADETARGHAAAATYWLECPVSSTLAFDSYAAAMSLVSVLADGVLSASGRHVRLAEVE